jgi:hypothetical protein
MVPYHRRPDPQPRHFSYADRRNHDDRLSEISLTEHPLMPAIEGNLLAAAERARYPFGASAWLCTGTHDP